MYKLLVCWLIFMIVCRPVHPLSPGREAEPFPRKPAEKTIRFSGYTWTVRNITGQQGPGPNFFSDRCVWVDPKGFLHLLIQKDATGDWLCAEVSTQESFGFGSYSFGVTGPIDRIDKNIVLGLFNYSGHDGYDEIDIEIARWGNSSYPNLNYTVWPAEPPYQHTSYTKEISLEGQKSVQRFSWYGDSVLFASLAVMTDHQTSSVASWRCVHPPASISRKRMPVHINFWLFKGHPPENGKNVEIVVQDFRYKGF